MAVNNKDLNLNNYNRVFIYLNIVLMVGRLKPLGGLWI